MPRSDTERIASIEKKLADMKTQQEELRKEREALLKAKRDRERKAHQRHLQKLGAAVESACGPVASDDIHEFTEKVFHLMKIGETLEDICGEITDMDTLTGYIRHYKAAIQKTQSRTYDEVNTR